ncbi:T9SS type A sorting domain-containing protein [Chryseobacterium limigenitum]|uniref:Delta-60 repeat domain-containing protein/Por secretion system C-terminal sorting domain-containing protein n=1 Tax=Chryseobacterium limigenitum TaxID=1612149 RepID=A0A1K2IT60_9FLAO|nr:T9SS type A sorting domain-containing protein [Chryseobacterium limigenitum]SFZ95494.1 delta-60 repeat domain-containing protein/Por secretion system C-terminal sorting domain-containing protein [Chryseobacterium limigenitum]
MKYKFFPLIFFSTFFNGQITLTKDTSFGNNGIFEFTNYNTNAQYNYGYFFQNADGSFILHCLGDASPTMDNFMIKIQSYGALDSSFGTNGKIHLDDFEAVDILPQDNNHFLVNYYSTNKYVKKYNLNGQLDTSFASTGTSTVNSLSNPIVVNNDGGFFSVGDDVLGSVSTSGLYKYSSNGNLDNSYGDNGYKVFNFPWSGNRIISSNNALYFLGYENETTGINAKLAKFNYSGNLDSSFGTNGKINLNEIANLVDNVNYFNDVSDFYLKPDGSLYVVTSVVRTNDQLEEYSNFFVFNSNGTVNTNFHSNGFVSIPSTNTASIQSKSIITAADYNSNYFLLFENKLISYSPQGATQTINGSNIFSDGYSANFAFKNIKVYNNALYLLVCNYNENKIQLIKYNINTTNLNTDNIPNNKINISVYPNPVKDILNIETDKRVEDVKVYDSSGKLINSLSFDNNKLNISTLSKGFYLIKIKVGDTYITKKFVKE